jgi:hypothetical protein
MFRSFRCSTSAIVASRSAVAPLNAHRSADTFVGSGGITSLHRRPLTGKMAKSFYAGEPEAPAFVAEAAQP